jgi:hypothetical protein
MKSSSYFGPAWVMLGFSVMPVGGRRSRYRVRAKRLRGRPSARRADSVCNTGRWRRGEVSLGARSPGGTAAHRSAAGRRSRGSAASRPAPARCTAGWSSLGAGTDDRPRVRPSGRVSAPTPGGCAPWSAGLRERSEPLKAKPPCRWRAPGPASVRACVRWLDPPASPLGSGLARRRTRGFGLGPCSRELLATCRRFECHDDMVSQAPCGARAEMPAPRTDFMKKTLADAYSVSPAAPFTPPTRSTAASTSSCSRWTRARSAGSGIDSLLA